MRLSPAQVSRGTVSKWTILPLQLLPKAIHLMKHEKCLWNQKVLALVSQQLDVGAASPGLDRGWTGFKCETRPHCRTPRQPALPLPCSGGHGGAGTSPTPIASCPPALLCHRLGFIGWRWGDCASPGISVIWHVVAKQVHQYQLILEVTWPAHEHGQEVHVVQLEGMINNHSFSSWGGRCFHQCCEWKGKVTKPPRYCQTQTCTVIFSGCRWAKFKEQYPEAA